MSIAVKNTFLDVPDHKFLCFGEPCCTERRCHSVPRTWKPVMPPNKSMKRTLSRSSSFSTESGFSFCSTLESFEAADVAVGTYLESGCATPTSSLDGESPREFADVESDVVSNTDDTKIGHDDNTNDSNSTPIAGNRTKLKGEAPAFQPMPKDTRFDVVTNAVYLALVSCGQTHNAKVEKGVQGASSTLISAELQCGTCSAARCYDAVHLAKQALEEVTVRLDNVALLSKRVQKEDGGYSLRSSIACVPKGAEDSVCWDLFHKGNCPRRSKCQWYHPQEADIGRVKVNIKCTEVVSGVSSEEQLPASYPVVRHKISLGELV
jgi:hypothetical protein